MGIAVSLIVVAVGAILAFAVDPSGDPAVDPNAAGWIIMIVGIVGLILDVLLWESWGPRHMRRRRVAYEPGYPERPSSTAPRRTVVEHEVVEPRAGPPPP